MLTASDWAWYNALTWPAPLVAYAVGVLALALVFVRVPRRYLVISLLLSVFWIGEVITFAILSKQILHPMSVLVYVIFGAQAVLMIRAGVRGEMRFGFSGRASSWVGLAIITYAMVGYPVATALLGHPFPNGPAFGVAPCPMVMFTLGMLLLTDSYLPKYLIVIPALLGLLGLGSGLMMGAAEDLGLAIAGPVAAYLVYRRPTPSAPAPTVVAAE